MTCGGNVMYFGAKAYGPAKKPTKSALALKAKKAVCRADGMVYNPKTKMCRSKKVRSDKKPASLRVRTNNAASMKQIRAACNKEGLVYDTKTKMCRPSKRVPAKPKASPKPKAYGPAKKPTKSALALKAKKAVCRADGMVYDSKAKKCRDSRRRRALAAFGLMHSTPSKWPQATMYYQAPKFSKPDLLLGKTFQAVANKAAQNAAQTAAQKVATQAVKSAVTKPVIKAAVAKAVNKAMS